MNDNRNSKRAIAIARRWRIGLVVSLALNLFLVGVVGVWAVKPLFRGPPSQPEMGRVIDRMANRLQPGDAAILRGAYDKRRDRVAKLSVDLREAREKMRRSLRADPFDPAALEEAMGGVRHTRTEFEETLQDIVREGAAAMSSDGRRMLARGPQGRD
jgi:uncharacterized membrane protein